MDPIKYGEYLKNSIPNAKYASGKKEINCRCMYCADSKNTSKGHFYISIPVDETKFSEFYCQKCGARGYVTNTKLIEWGLFDGTISIELNSHNKKIMKLPSNKKFHNDMVYNIRYTNITDDKLTRYKLNYVNGRIGTSLTYKDCIKEKIILNINDLFKQNNITKFTRHEYILNCLDTSFVGFLSYDNSFINMRNMEINEVPSSINKRYINYNIFDNIDNTHRFYLIPTVIDLMNPMPIEIHIAEGPFDILSIYHNMNGGNNTQKIFAAVAGSGYRGLIRFLINILKIVNPVIHIYPDKDIEQYKMDNIASLLYPFHLNMFIHRNIYPGEKDFGVPMKRIKDSVMKIL